MIENLYRYPVKGLSAERMDEVHLEAGQGFPFDREFALTNGSWSFAADGFVPRPKTDYLALVKYERLAQVSTRYEPASNILTLAFENAEPARYCLADPEDRASLVSFFARLLADAPLPGKPELVQAPGIRFTDISVDSTAMMNAISLISLSSVASLSEAIGGPVDPLRFRANVYFSGREPWEELNWVGREMRMGAARLRVVMKTRRCAATNVNPGTAKRDIGIPQTLLKTFKHGNCGVYAEVIEPGEVRVGDRLELL